MRRLIVPLLVAAVVPVAAAADIEQGRRLHDQQCTRCHVERYGGDGSKMYTRPDRLIHDRAALGRRVATCNAMTNAGLLPEDEENIAAYLAQRYYKFK